MPKGKGSFCVNGCGLSLGMVDIDSLSGAHMILKGSIRFSRYTCNSPEGKYRHRTWKSLWLYCYIIA